MPGFLIPHWYRESVPSPTDLQVASLVWGFSLGCGLFTAAKCFRQAVTSYKRQHRLTPYVTMIILEWFISMAIGVISWLFIRGNIAPSFQIYFTFIALWVIQIQVILQIIINRISLLLVPHDDAKRLAWLVGLLIGIINISVFIIWIPARMQVSETWIRVNSIWDRLEKAIFCVVDVSLNAYFVHLVRTKLIANGLTKYMSLLRFNLVMIFFSMSLDVVLIAVMSLPNSFLYVQFHPLVYLLKLHVEMTMAELIAKIVRAANGDDNTQNRGLSCSAEMQDSRKRKKSSGKTAQLKSIGAILSGEANCVTISNMREASHGSQSELPPADLPEISQTSVVSKTFEDDAPLVSEASSSAKQPEKMV